MKKTHVFSLFAATIVMGFAACNNNGNDSASTDTTATTSTATTTQTSSRNYAAMADSFKMNSDAGNYLEPKTGKPVRITVSSAGTLVDENGTPIRRYVDKRTWWVYDANTGDTVGSARMENGTLKYRGDNDQWMNYDEKWHDDMDSAGSMNNGNMNNSNNMNNGSTNNGSTNSGSTNNGNATSSPSSNNNNPQ